MHEYTAHTDSSGQWTARCVCRDGCDGCMHNVGMSETLVTIGFSGAFPAPCSEPEPEPDPAPRARA
jgi:hypothetical protein